MKLHIWARSTLLAFIGLCLICAGACGDGGSSNGVPTTTATPTTTPIAGLSIQKINICSDIEGYGKYTVQPDAIFKICDKIGVYFEVVGFACQVTGTKYEHWVEFSEISIEDPFNYMETVTELDEHHYVAHAPVGQMWFSTWHDSSEDYFYGLYTIHIAVEDKLSGETATATAEYTIASEPTPEPPDLSIYPTPAVGKGNIAGQIEWNGGSWRLQWGKTTRAELYSTYLGTLGCVDEAPLAKAFTDEDGYFLFKNVDPGEYRIGVYCPSGFTLCHWHITVDANKTQWCYLDPCECCTRH